MFPPRVYFQSLFGRGPILKRYMGQVLRNIGGVYITPKTTTATKYDQMLIFWLPQFNFITFCIKDMYKLSILRVFNFVNDSYVFLS